MADLLLSHGYFLGEDEKEQQIMRPYPPLGLLYLSAFLKRAGFAVEVFDSTLRSRAELSVRLEARTAPVIGLYTTLMTRRSVLDITAAAKQHGWTVVLGGPESANHPHEYLARGADVIVVGEGEQTMADLLPALATRGPHRLHDVAGTIFRDEAGTCVSAPPRALIADLDSVPWPDRQAIDVQAYVDLWRTHHGRGSVNLITARGCAYRCNWCSHSVYGFTHRRRSVIDCADEVEWIRDTYHPDQLWYADDVFTIHPSWLTAFARELDRRGIRLPFETITRADRMLRDEVVDALAALGCYRIWIGAESGSQRILDAMQRGVTREQVQQASHAAQRRGIEVGMFLMWGYEGETPDDMADTVDLVQRASPNVFFTTIAYPIAKTGYFDKVRDRVSLPVPWEDASDRQYEIAGRPDRSYYKLADTWLRAAVEAHRTHDDAERAAALTAQAEAARAALLARHAAAGGIAGWRARRSTRSPVTTTGSSPTRSSAARCATWSGSDATRVSRRACAYSRSTAAPVKTPCTSGAAACACSPPTRRRPWSTARGPRRRRRASEASSTPSSSASRTWGPASAPLTASCRTSAASTACQTWRAPRTGSPRSSPGAVSHCSP